MLLRRMGTFACCMALAGCASVPEAPPTARAPKLRQVAQRRHDMLEGHQVLQRTVGDRSYELLVPRAVAAGRRMPLVVLLHGYACPPHRQNDEFWLASLIEEKKFVLALPAGRIDRRDWPFWNATDACCDHFLTGVDDLGFLRDMIDATVAELALDAERVFAVGHSNGAFMAHRLACDASDKVAAIVSVGGRTFAEGADGAPRCNPKRPVHLLQIEGLRDKAIRIDGGKAGVEKRLPPFPSVEATLRTWHDIDGCSDVVRNETVEPLDLKFPQSPGQLTSWQCSRAAVDSVQFPDSGHVPHYDQRFARYVWEWLDRHGRDHQ